MTDTAARVAGLDDERLLDLHKSLDRRDVGDPAVVEAHHLVAVEMLKRGHQHGHEGDQWASAAVLVERVAVDGPDEIEAPEGLAEAWEGALAKGGEVSILLTADGYVLKAAPRMDVDDSVDSEDGPLDWDSDDLLSTLSDGDKVWLGTVAAILDGGGDPDEAVEKAGNPEPLRDYWRSGGKGKINWGGGGDFTACAAAVSKYMTSEQAKGYCAIRHREVTGMWPGDKRNRAQKALELDEDVTVDPDEVGVLTLPDGTTYRPVMKHGSHNQKDHGRRGGGLSMDSSDLKAVKRSLSRGEQVESYGEGYARGKDHAKGRDADGEPVKWRVSSTGTGNNALDNAVRARDAALDAFHDTDPNDIGPARSTLAATVARSQGFIDGVVGSKPSMARSHNLGETLAGLVFGGLSGATKAVDLVEQVEKHGDPSRPGYAAMHPNSTATGGGYTGDRKRRERTMREGKEPTNPRRSGAQGRGRVINPDATGGYKAGIPTKVEFGGETLTPEHSLWHHLEPDGAGGFRITAERAALHAKIVEDATRGVPVSENPTFYMLGGGPAAGKTTAVKSGLAGTPEGRAAVQINADDIKSALPEFERMRTSRDDTDFFTGASFAHEESSYLAKAVQRAAIANRQDVVLDGTGDSKYTSLVKKVGQARAAGYAVHGVYATVPTATAVARAKARSLKEGERRYVPEAVVTGTHRDVSAVFPQAVAGGLFDSARLIDTTTFGKAVLIGETADGQWTIRDQGRWDEFVAKGTE